MNTTTSNTRKSAATGAIAALLLAGASAAKADCLDGGLTLEPGAITEVIPHPTEPDTLFVTQRYVSQDVSADGQALLKSCDSGETWSATALTSDFYDVLSLGVDPTNPEIVYAQTNRGALLSIDGGITWAEFDMPYGDIVFAADGTLYLASSPFVFRRLPGAIEFEEMTEVPGAFNVLRVDPGDANRLHVGSHYSVDGGASWQTVLTGRAADVRFSPSDPSRLAVTDDPLRLSIDGGVNWQRPEFEEFSPFIPGDFKGRQVLFDGADSSTLWVSLEGCGLFRSEDFGRRWFFADQGLTGSAPFCRFNGGHPFVEQLYANPTDTDRYYAVTSDGLFVSNDDGQSWTTANGTASALPPGPPPPNPYSGDADLEFELFKVPKKFTPPAILKFKGRITNNGPDTARDVSFSIPADVVSISRGSCDQNGCQIGDLPPGATVELQFEREMLSGGNGTRCTGDKFTISGRVSAETNDPNQANNEATGEVTRENGPSLISGCPNGGLLRPVDEKREGGGGSTGLLFLAGLLAARRFARKLA